MAGVWREVEVKCHRFGIEGGLDVPSFNLQAQVHENYFLRALAEGPTEPACIQAVLKLRPVPLIIRWVRVVKPNSKAVSMKRRRYRTGDGRNFNTCNSS